jgi:hypothetical protein
MQHHPHPLRPSLTRRRVLQGTLAALPGWPPGSRAGGGAAPLPLSTAHPVGR